MKTIREGRSQKNMPKDHPGRLSACVFDQTSLMDEDEKTLIVLHSVKLFLPAEAAKKLVVEIQKKCLSGPERTIEETLLLPTRWLNSG